MNWYKKAKLDRQAGIREVVEKAKEQMRQMISTGKVVSVASAIALFSQYNLSAAEIEAINVPQLIEEIKRHEGSENVSYNDTRDIRTVGVGFNLEDAGAKSKIEKLGLSYEDVFNGNHTLTDDQVDSLLGDGLAVAIKDARSFVGVDSFESQPSEVKHILINMSFNLGGPRLSGFSRLRRAVRARDYQQAALEMKYKNPSKSKQFSDWFVQTKGRAKELFEKMRSVK